MTNAIYNAIANRLLNKSPVVWVDIYGAQPDVTDTEHPIQYPAAFLDCRIDDTTSLADCQEVHATLIVHLVVEDYRDSRKTNQQIVHYNPLAVKHNVFAALQRFSGSGFTKLLRTGETTHPNYDALTEFQMEFSFRYKESYLPTVDGELIGTTIKIAKPPPKFEKEVLRSV